MKKALVVVDMQKDFVTGSLGSVEANNIKKNVVDKIQAYISQNKNIFVTMDTHNENYMDTQEGRNLPVKHCIKGSDGWKLELDIENSLNNYINVKFFEKPSFGSSKLANYIQDNHKDLEEIELVGVCTDICVISNAVLIKTVLPEVKITVDASCCAGVSVEKHNATLEVMKSLQINVINE